MSRNITPKYLTSKLIHDLTGYSTSTIPEISRKTLFTGISSRTLVTLWCKLEKINAMISNELIVRENTMRALKSDIPESTHLTHLIHATKMGKNPQ